MKNAIIIFALLFPIILFSQELFQDVVYLKNGKIIKGVIIKEIPGESIKIKTTGGRNINVDEYEIDSIAKETFSRENFFEATGDEYFLKNKNEYWSVATGLGSSYGGMGVRFQQRLGERMGFGYHAGIGYSPADSSLNGYFGFNIGVKFFYIKSYYIDLQYGTIGLLYYEDAYGNKLNQEILYGPSLMAGGDWFFSQYFGMNGGIGVSFNVSHRNLKAVMLNIDLGLVLKFK